MPGVIGPWAQGPDDHDEEPDGYCSKHGTYSGDECWHCEQDIEMYEEEKRDRWHRDNPEDDYIA